MSRHLFTQIHSLMLRATRVPPIINRHRSKFIAIRHPTIYNDNSRIFWHCSGENVGLFTTFHRHTKTPISATSIKKKT